VCRKSVLRKGYVLYGCFTLCASVSIVLYILYAILCVRRCIVQYIVCVALYSTIHCVCGTVEYNILCVWRCIVQYILCVALCSIICCVSVRRWCRIILFTEGVWCGMV
jgi:hypothetical protein